MNNDDWQPFMATLLLLAVLHQIALYYSGYTVPVVP